MSGVNIGMILRHIFEKIFTKDVISGIISGIITAALLAVFAVWYDGATRRSKEAELLYKVGIGANKEYIDSILGVPVMEIADFNELTNAFYPLKYTTVRCVYEDNVTVAFFITTKSKANVYKIPQNNHCARNYLGKIKLSDIDNEGLGIINVPAGNLEYMFYEEKLGGSHADNFNYILFGIYGNEDYFTDDLISLGMGMNTEELTAGEIQNIRQKTYINTYGEVSQAYENAVGICPGVDYIGSYFSLLY